MIACKSYIVSLLLLLCPTALVTVGVNSPRPGAEQSAVAMRSGIRPSTLDHSRGIGVRPERDSSDCVASIATIEEDDEDGSEDVLESRGFSTPFALPPASNHVRSFDATSPTSWESRLRWISMRC